MSNFSTNNASMRFGEVRSVPSKNPSKNVVSANESKDLRVLFCDYGFDEYTRDLVLINQCEVFPVLS